MKAARDHVDHGALVAAIEKNIPSLIHSAVMPSLGAMRAKMMVSFPKVAEPLFVDVSRKMRAAANVQVAMGFDSVDTDAAEWARKAAGELISDVSETTRESIQRVLERAFNESLTPEQTANLIEPLIGLDSRRAEAVLNLRDEILDSPGETVYAGSVAIRVPEDGFNDEDLDRKLDRYADRLLGQRAITIARTEAVDASTESQNMAWDHLIDQGVLSQDDQKQWYASATACKICQAMDGQIVGIQENFVTPDGDEIDGPGAHPNCECGQSLVVPEDDEGRIMGGKGSGNFGHSGRKGEVGGSGEGEAEGTTSDLQSTSALGSPITSSEKLGGGKNVTLKVTLKDGTEAVFKPESGDKSRVREGIPKGLQSEREAAAWEIAKIVDVGNLIAETVVTEHNGEKGSLATWVNNAKTAVETSKEARLDGEEARAHAAMFDYIIGNQDRHTGNWMVTKEGGLKLIDHGIAFSSADFKLKDSHDQFLAAMAKSSSSPKEYAQRYLNKVTEIKAALRKLGIPEKSVQKVKSRIKKASKAPSWADLYGERH